MKKIIIFGAGNTGKKAFQFLISKYNVVAFSDNNNKLWGTEIFGIPVIEPTKISYLQADEIIIASIYHLEIVRQLNELGIQNIKLFKLKKDGKDVLLLKTNNKNPFEQCKYRNMNLDSSAKHEYFHEKLGKRKVLIIAYYFPPLGGSAIQRTLKFVKYLREFGYEPIILTVEPDEASKEDNLDYSMLSDIPEKIEIIRIKDDFGWQDVITEEQAQEIVEFLYTISQSADWLNEFKKEQAARRICAVPDRLIFWANKCVRSIEKFIDVSEIDLLYSTVPELSPHLVAYYLKKKYGIRWVADYRDPWVSNKNYIELYYKWMKKSDIELNRKLEKSIVCEMDFIVVAGGTWIEDFVKNYGVSRKKIVEITNGFDEEDFATIERKKEKNSKFTLCYNGILAYNRNPIPLLKVINGMILQGTIAANEIQWIFNGNIPKKISDEMEKEDIYRIVRTNGVLSHIDSVQIGINADVMILYGEFGEFGYLNYPGKFYEYLRMGNPILCFSQENSFQHKVLKETNLGENIDMHDSESIEKFLLNHYLEWKNGRNQNVLKKDVIQKYERRTLTKALAEIFNNVIEGKNGEK